ncbi:auxin response factor 2 [Tripterygium wilfordii]|uniref:Auxin response factor 2 n=1 Tax=Tripterygium wilfordii TaxID=458696 RepID=A0A7J7DK16_TRIWF|nr:auxin response factor 2 [Tripterygium wilfordii]
MSESINYYWIYYGSGSQSRYWWVFLSSAPPPMLLGRSVDLTKFNSYDELIVELDWLFEFGGELMDSKKNWLIVYTEKSLGFRDEDEQREEGLDMW